MNKIAIFPPVILSKSTRPSWYGLSGGKKQVDPITWIGCQLSDSDITLTTRSVKFVSITFSPQAESRDRTQASNEGIETRTPKRLHRAVPLKIDICLHDSGIQKIKQTRTLESRLQQSPHPTISLPPTNAPNTRQRIPHPPPHKLLPRRIHLHPLPAPSIPNNPSTKHHLGRYDIQQFHKH